MCAAQVSASDLASSNSAGSSSSSAEEVSEFVSGYPPPPVFFHEYIHGPSARLPPDPPPPNAKYLDLFNSRIQLEHHLPGLDSDTLLYDPDVDLKTEFARLYRLYAQQIFRVLDVVQNCRSNDVSSIKQLTKLNQNLCHILTLLRRHEAAELILERLRAQLEEKRRCIRCTDSALNEVRAFLAKPVDKEQIADNASPQMDP